MVRDEAADLGGILQPALVEPTILIAAGWRVAFSLGVTQQHQTAHWRDSRLSFGAIKVQLTA
jgi:hypothetical protein